MFVVEALVLVAGNNELGSVVDCGPGRSHNSG
jgi:hypothetical protein